ncbi:MAG: hypothetical protein Q9219_005165 [cf. Caloplaca sp. 3 TL-2023]
MQQFPHAFFFFFFSHILLPFILTTIFYSNHARCWTGFPSDHATCVNSTAVLRSVVVKPWCDNAISTVCGTAVSALANYDHLINLKAFGVPPSRLGSCEVNLLFYEPYPSFPFTYDICVEAFQSITIDCMLIGYGKHAGKNHQAGVRGVVYNENGEDGSAENPMFAALEPTSPGFMVGPPDAYGNISAVDLTHIVPGNVAQFNESCIDKRGTRICQLPDVPYDHASAVSMLLTEATPVPARKRARR